MPVEMVTLVVDRDALDGGYTGEVSDLPGYVALAQGESVLETWHNLFDAYRAVADLAEADQIAAWGSSASGHQITATRATVTLEIGLDSLDGGYIASVPSLPGCLAQGETPAEAGHNLLDAYHGMQMVAATAAGLSYRSFCAPPAPPAEPATPVNRPAASPDRNGLPRRLGGPAGDNPAAQGR